MGRIDRNSHAGRHIGGLKNERMNVPKEVRENQKKALNEVKEGASKLAKDIGKGIKQGIKNNATDIGCAIGGAATGAGVGYKSEKTAVGAVRGAIEGAIMGYAGSKLARDSTYVIDQWK